MKRPTWKVILGVHIAVTMLCVLLYYLGRSTAKDHYNKQHLTAEAAIAAPEKPALPSWLYIVPQTLPDGTRCVVAYANKWVTAAQVGVAMTCDWYGGTR